MAAIEVDDQATWPDELSDYVENAQRGLLLWADREREIRELQEHDVTARVRPPSNPHSELAQTFVDSIDDMFRGYSLVARHCTRLHETEIAQIEADGVEPLSPELASRRLDALCARGVISASQADALSRRSLSAETNRRDRTWWILGRSPLRSASGVYRLFRSWGGEAIYWANEGGDLGDVLRRIGVAAIVEAEVPCAMLDPIWSIGWRLRDALGAQKHLDFEATTSSVVPPLLIRGVIRHGTEEFEALTGASTWDIALTETG